MVQPSFPQAPVQAALLHRLTVAQYQRMAREGILDSEDRVELLEGLLVDKMTKNPPHRIATRRTRVELERLVPEGWYVDTQEPIVTLDSEPEPDVCVVRGRTEDYLAQNPPASATGLVVEVAGHSRERDRDLKARIYARAGVPTYWLIDLTERTVEVHSNPTGPGPEPHYRSQVTVGVTGTVELWLDGSSIGSISVSALLP